MEDMRNKNENLLELIKNSVEVVLVNTSHSGNIGAVARAMKNMGLTRLRLVSPKSFPSEEADARAAGASDILQGAVVHECLSDAIADSTYVVGASARVRSFPWPLANPRECVQTLLGLINQSASSDSALSKHRIALVFGRESSGLTNEELQLCNLHVNIPANPDYSSLNLAMAVQVIAYELRMSAVDQTLVLEDQSTSLAILGPQDAGWDNDASTAQEVEGMLQHLETVVTRTEYYDPANPGMLMPRLKRLFQRAGLDKMEVNILRGILKSIERALSK